MRKPFLLLAWPILSSCGQRFEAPPPPTFPILIRVESDPGIPLPGAQLARQNAPLGVSGPDGKFSTVLQGIEGDVWEVKVSCPAGYESPSRPLMIPLRRLSENRPAEFSASCAPSVRQVVVVIRADNGPFIPIIHLNNVIGRTDRSGTATFLANVRPNDQLEFMLKTSDNTAFKRHHPQDPTLAYLVQPMNDVVVLSQEFKVDKPPPAPVFKPKIPVMIPSRRY